MAASSGLSGFGTLLIWNYHRLLEMAGISGPSQSCDAIEVTSHDSDDGYREFIAGPISGGDLSLDGNLITEDDNGQVAFYTDLQAGTKRTVWVVPPMANGSALTFDAIAKGFTPNAPMDDKVGVSGTLQVTGKPTLLTTQSTGISALSGIEENESAALEISPAAAAGTYEYTCTVDTASTYIKLTITAASHTIYAQGTSQTSGVQGGEIALNAAGETTEVFFMVYEANKAPRLYVLTVTRPAA